MTNDMTHGAMADGREIDWDDIDPTVFIGDGRQAYLFWGNTKLRYAKLAPITQAVDGLHVRPNRDGVSRLPGAFEPNDRISSIAKDFQE